MIREAVESDIESMVRIGEIFWKFTDYYRDGEEYNPVLAETHARLAVEHGIGLVSDNGGIDGFILFVVTNSPFSGVSVASELAFFVMPDARGNGIGGELLFLAERIAMDRGVFRMAVSNMDGVDPYLSDMIFRDQGYVPCETTYTKKIAK